jgi:serine/threonine-protein kinase RsbW
VLPSDVSQLDPVVAHISALLAQTGCQHNLKNVDLALQEALANAIIHGSRSDPARAVRVCVAVQEDCGVLIVVKDAGSGFDPSRLPNPLVGQNLLAPHGRGIYLLNQFMDDVRYSFNGGTAVTLRREPPPSPHAPVADDGPAVIVYTLPGCRACNQAKVFLAEKGIRFTERDLATDDDALQEILSLDHSRLPVISVEGRVVSGFDRARLEELLG